MSYIIHFKIADDDEGSAIAESSNSNSEIEKNSNSSHQKQLLTGMELATNAMSQYIEENNEKAGMIIHTTSPVENDELLDLTLLYVRKFDANDMANLSALEISFPDTFKIFSEPILQDKMLENALPIAVDNYKHKILTVIDKQDLIFTTHKGVEIAKLPNFITLPDKDKLPFIEDDGEVILKSVAIDDSMASLVADNNILNKINVSKCLDYINTDKFGKVYRIFDDSDGAEKIKFYNKNGHLLATLEDLSLILGADINKVIKETVTLNLDGSAQVGDDIFTKVSIDPVKLACITDKTMNVGQFYIVLNEDSELVFYTHTGIKFAAFNINEEYEWLSNNALSVDNDGNILKTIKRIDFARDIDDKYFTCTDDGIYICEDYRLVDKDGVNFSDNNNEPIYVILDHHNKVRFVTKAGIIVEERDIQIPALNNDVLARITHSGDYYLLTDDSNFDIFSSNSFVTSAVDPNIDEISSIKISYTDQQFFDQILDQEFLINDLEARSAFTADQKTYLKENLIVDDIKVSDIFLKSYNQEFTIQNLQSSLKDQEWRVGIAENNEAILTGHMVIKNQEIASLTADKTQLENTISTLLEQIKTKDEEIEDLTAKNAALEIKNSISESAVDVTLDENTDDDDSNTNIDSSAVDVTLDENKDDDDSNTNIDSSAVDVTLDENTDESQADSSIEETMEDKSEEIVTTDTSNVQEAITEVNNENIAAIKYFPNPTTSKALNTECLPIDVSDPLVHQKLDGAVFLDSEGVYNTFRVRGTPFITTPYNQIYPVKEYYNLNDGKFRARAFFGDDMQTVGDYYMDLPCNETLGNPDFDWSTVNQYNY